MSGPKSGFPLIPNEQYITPQWVWDVLYDQCPVFRWALDPFPPDYSLDWRDAVALEDDKPIASNPPFSLAEEAARAIEGNQHLALLLPVAWDCAKRRIDLARKLERKIVLTKRIRWANLPQDGQPKHHHAWYIWGGTSKEPVLQYT